MKILISFAIITQQILMEKNMSALQKLQKKIEEWKVNHEALKTENSELKRQVEGIVNSNEDELRLTHELAEKSEKCIVYESTIATLKQELKEKDVEIEKIIMQVETLLD